MQITDLITVERIACGVPAAGKKHALDLLSELLASGLHSLTAGELCTGLIEREILGSTGLGRGVAIPHGRLKECPQAIGAFLKLNQGVEFDAPDRQPVDLLFALIVPEQCTDEHLEILALLAGLFSDKALCQALRSATHAGKVFGLLTEWQAQHAPA